MDQQDDLLRLLPERFIALHPMLSEDAALLAQWINRGREEGFFTAGPALTEEAILDYQNNRQGRDGKGYSCLIVEDKGGKIGYIDYEFDSDSAEILGVYLVPSYRGRRIGRHLLRVICADLRVRGCKRVDIEVFVDNPHSLSACYAVGFHRVVSASIREGGRGICLLGRSVLPFRRFCARDSGYARLQGNAWHLNHVAIAEEVADFAKGIDGVEVVLGLGSVARGFADDWSDVDVAVLGRGAGLERLGRGERWLPGFALDLSVVDLDVSPPETWDYSRRQAFEEAVVLWERDSAVTNKVEQALPLTGAERTERIRDLIIKIGWCGFQPRAWSGGMAYGYAWLTPWDLWLRRGCVDSAQVTVDQVYDLFIELVYLANCRHVPDQKWRRFLLPGLRWLPEGAPDLIRQVEVRGTGEEDFRRRASALLNLIEAVVAYIELNGDLSGDIYAMYIAAHKDY